MLGLRIHLQLNGKFLYFLTRSLTLEVQETWDEFPVVYLTPNSDHWDPQATHFAEAEAAMLDSSDDIVTCKRARWTIFDKAEISQMYAELSMWEILMTELT